MEDNFAPNSDTTDKSLTIFGNSDDFQMQEKMMPQPVIQVDDQLLELGTSIASSCPLINQCSNADSELSPSSEIPSASTSSKTPFKQQKHSFTEFKKFPKRPFRTPTKNSTGRSLELKNKKSPKEGSQSKRKKLGETIKAVCDEEVLPDFGKDDNKKFDDNLEEKASRVKMTAKNVKSVIHHLLTDESVLSMFRDAIESEKNEASTGQSSPRKKDSTPEKLDAVGKLTRAKVREFLEKICMPSPVKVTKEGPSILDVEFNEEEDDDDEYNPEKDEECHESDDESVTSSKLSDFGSPFRDLTSSLITRSTKVEDSEPPNPLSKETVLDVSTESLAVCAGAKDSGNVVITTVTDTLQEETIDGVDTIALRTRSKLPLTSTSITEIESAFIAPDITADMYDNNYIDPDWNQFLLSLNKPTDDTVIDDDASANDPDFNYIAEAERIEPDEEDFRFDKLTQIPKKELSTLLRELNDLFEDEVLPHQVVATASAEVTDSDNLPSMEDQYMQASFGNERLQFQGQDMQLSSSGSFTNFKVPQAPPLSIQTKCGNTDQDGISKQNSSATASGDRLVQESVVSHEQRALIEDNMRKHIQLLSQSFLLFQGSSSKLQDQDLTDTKSLIMELNYFRQASSAAENSVYNVCNLTPAINLISDPELSQGTDTNESDPYMLPVSKKLAIYNSPAFVYPHLLPSLRKPKGNMRKYSKFTHNEDNLIALGLEQFQECRGVSPAELLCKLLIRGKNIDQIYFRIQFMCSKKVGDNPIKCVKKTGKLPENFPRPTVDNFYSRAPRYQISDLLPSWCSGLKNSRTKTPYTENYRQIKLSSNSCSHETSAEKMLQESVVNVVDENILGNSKCQQIHNEDMQKTGHSQASLMPATEIFQGSSLLSLPSDMPTIMGLYIQFAPPPSSQSNLPHDSHVVKLPVLAQKPLCPRRSIKRKAAPSARSSVSKKRASQIQSDIDLGQSTVNNAGTQTDECTSPDLLAKTMQSCGIEESPIHLSLQSLMSLGSGKNQADMPFSTSTPVVQDKHPTVRNLRWEFDAAQEQSATRAQSTETLNNTQPQETLISDSGEMSVDIELEQDFKSNTNSKELQELAAQTKYSTEEQVNVTDSSVLLEPNVVSVCVHRLTSHPEGDKPISHGQLSQTAVSYDTTLSLNLEIVTVDKEKTSQSTASCGRSSSELEITEESLMPHQLHSHCQFPASSASQPHTSVPASGDAQALVSESDSYTISERSNCEASENVQEQTLVQSGTQSMTLLQGDKPTINCIGGAASEADVETTAFSEVTLQSPDFENKAASFQNKTLTNVSLSVEKIIDRTDLEIQRKPKTVSQILNASKERTDNDKLTSKGQSPMEHDETFPASNNCILEYTDSLTISNILNPSANHPCSPVKTSETCKPEQAKISQEGTQESSMNLHQTNKPIVIIPVSLDAATSPSKTIALIAIESPAKSSNSQNLLSPFKTPTKHRPLIAKSASPGSSHSSPYVPLSKVSKKRKELNMHVHQILPKSFIFEVKSPSPTKAAARVLKKKAALFSQSRSPLKLLPKQTQLVPPATSRLRPLFTPTRMFTRSQKMKLRNAGKKSIEEPNSKSASDEKPPSKDKEVNECEMSEAEDAGLSQEEEEEEEIEDENQSQLDDLMAACTTIRYDPKKGSSTDSDNKSKAQKKKDVCLSMVDPDILDRDPKKDERDTAYAQEYFTRVKQVLSDDPDRFKKFLTILHDLNKNHFNPVELYVDMTTLLSDHQDLVDDFAGFMLSFQAVECQCFVSHLEYEQILTFLRRLEIYCDTSNMTFQRTLKMMSRWLTMSQDAQADSVPFKDRISAVLRHVPSIMDDLMSYFFDAPLPDSHDADFEEVDLTGDVPNEMDEFEEITLPESQEDYNTKSCSCHCHQDQQDEKLRRRIKHCFSCSLKMLDGKPVLKTSRSEYQPISVLYPLEEKEKMVKAKREAAQLALAKARARRQQNKKRNKQGNVQKLKNKNSKKKFKRRNKSKAVDSSADAGDPSKTIKEHDREGLRTEPAKNLVSSVAEEPDLTKSDFRIKNELYETGDNCACGSVSATPCKFCSCKENRNAETPSETVIVNMATDTVAADGHQSPDSYALSATQDTIKSQLSHETKDVTSSFKTVKTTCPEINSCEAASPIISTIKSPPLISDSNISVNSPSPFVGDTATESTFLTNTNSQPRINTDSQSSNNLEPQTNAVLKQQQSGSWTPQTGCAYSASTFHTPARLSVSQARCPQALRVLSSQTNHTNVHGASKTSGFAGAVPQFQIHTPPQFQPIFATAPVVSTRIPVIVTLSPQQYLCSPSALPVVQTLRPRQQNPQKPMTAASVTSISKNVKLSDDGPETQKPHQNLVLNLSSSYPEFKPQALSDICLPYPVTLEDNKSNLITVSKSCPSVTTSDCPSNSIVLSYSVTTMSDIPSTSLSPCMPTPITTASSESKLNNNPDIQLPPEATVQPPTTPLKEQISRSAIQAYLDNFSLGGFDVSLGPSQLQQFNHSASPSKLLTDSMSKFDLLALLESSNLSCRDLTLHAAPATVSQSITSESLLTFSGALAKIKATSEEPTPSSSLSTAESEEVPTKKKETTTPAVSSPSKPQDLDYASECGKSTPGSVKETDKELLNDLYHQLQPTNVTQDDEASNVFELSVWTEEQDRAILYHITNEGITKSTGEKLQSVIPQKSAEEITSRARLLLHMLDNMGDTESDTGTEASCDGQSESDL